jgi:hypothetical protein
MILISPLSGIRQSKIIRDCCKKREVCEKNMYIMRIYHSKILSIIFCFKKEWMKATNVRLRLLRAKTLLGEYLPLAKGDPTVTRRVSIASHLQFSRGSRGVSENGISPFLREDLNFYRILKMYSKHTIYTKLCLHQAP